MNRRALITLFGGMAASAVTARAQQFAGRPLIGILSPISPAAAQRNVEALRAGLRELGYSEDRNIALELRYADGAIERLPKLAAELVALDPAVIVAGSPAAALAVRAITRTIPVVMNSSPDPVRLGLASSIAHPGGNVTGFWWGDETLVGKRLGLLKEAVPAASRMALLVHSEDPTSVDEIKQVPIVSGALGLTLRVFEVRTPEEFEGALAVATREEMQGLCASTSPLFVSHRAKLASLAAHHRLPAIYAFREFAAAGGLMSYGASLSDLYRRKAGMIDKIIKGAKPTDIPIERPITFELLINLNSARALGLTLPSTLLARADEVIE